jgi:hypothetical protein
MGEFLNACDMQKLKQEETHLLTSSTMSNHIKAIIISPERKAECQTGSLFNFKRPLKKK